MSEAAGAALPRKRAWWEVALSFIHQFQVETVDKRSESPSGETAKAERDRKAVELLDAYGNSILRCAYAYLHNMSDAEEILQETLIRYLQAVPALESPAHEKAWLLRVAANLSKNRLRDNGLRATDELSDQVTAQEREDLSFVWDAVKALPSAERAAIHLYYCEGYTTQEIASILGRKDATIRSDLRRARLRLKEQLKEAYDFG